MHNQEQLVTIILFQYLHTNSDKAHQTSTLDLVVYNALILVLLCTQNFLALLYTRLVWDV